MDRRPPDLEGPGHARRYSADIRKDRPTPEVLHGPWRAWRARIDDPDRKKWPTGLQRWFIHAPGAHPLWDWHTIAGCSLRDVEGLPPAKLHRPGMTHEIDICAVNPLWDVVVDPTEADHMGSHLLRPANMIHQLGDLSDEMAEELIFLLTRAFVMGHANPDDDFKVRNVELLEGTAKHLREGKHLPS